MFSKTCGNSTAINTASFPDLLYFILRFDSVLTLNLCKHPLILSLSVIQVVCYRIFLWYSIFCFYYLDNYHMEASEAKWVNSEFDITGVNSLITYMLRQKFKYNRYLYKSLLITFNIIVQLTDSYMKASILRYKKLIFKCYIHLI